MMFEIYSLILILILVIIRQDNIDKKILDALDQHEKECLDDLRKDHEVMKSKLKEGEHEDLTILQKHNHEFFLIEKIRTILERKA